MLPHWFDYPNSHVQLWVPYGQTFTPEEWAQHDNHQSHVIARLKPGVSTEVATRAGCNLTVHRQDGR